MNDEFLDEIAKAWGEGWWKGLEHGHKGLSVCPQCPDDDWLASETKARLAMTSHEVISQYPEQRICQLEAQLKYERQRYTDLEQRHAEAVKDAYIEGYIRADWPDQVRDDAEEAWVDSEAKARLG